MKAILLAGIFLLSVSFFGLIHFKVLQAAQFVKYPVAARLYLENQLPSERISDYSPLYFSIHVFLNRIFANPERIWIWIQIMMSAGSVTMLFLLLRQHFGIAIALPGAIAFLLNRSLIGYTAILEPEALLVFLILSFLTLSFCKNYKFHLLGGFAFGLAILTRPNLIPLLLVIPFHFYFLAKRNTDTEFRPFRSTVAFTIPVIAAIVFLMIRNFTIAGYVSPVVMNPGTTFYEGNQPLSRGQSSVYPALLEDAVSDFRGRTDYQHELYRTFARRSENQNLKITQVNKYWMLKAARFLRDYPSHAWGLFRTKLLHCFHSFEWHDVSTGYKNEMVLIQNHIPAIPFSLIAALSLTGLLIAVTHWKEYLLFYAMFAIQIATMVMIYVSARQRLAILCIFVFFACVTVRFLYVSRKRWMAFAGVGLFVFIFQTRTDMMHEEDHLWKSTEESQRWMTAAYRLRSEHRYADAAKAAAIARSMAPWKYLQGSPANLPWIPEPEWAMSNDFSTQFDQALVLMNLGKLKEAEQIYLEFIRNGHQFKRQEYQSSEPYFYLGRIEELRNNPEKAVSLFQKGLSRSPGDPYLLSHLNALTQDEKYLIRLFRYFDRIDSKFYLGQAFFDTKHHEAAVSCFQEVVRLLPEYRRGYLFLAASLSRAQRYEESTEVYRRAIAMRPDPVLFGSEIIEAFRWMSEKNPDRLYQLYSYGVVLRQFGHYSEALAVQETALKKQPDNVEIQKEIEILKKQLQMPAQHQLSKH